MVIIYFSSRVLYFSSKLQKHCLYINDSAFKLAKTAPKHIIHWSHAHSSNESLLLTKTGPNMLTPSLSSETGRDQLREHNLGSPARSLVTHNTSQTFEERDHAFEPGWLNKSRQYSFFCALFHTHNLFLRKSFLYINYFCSNSPIRLRSSYFVRFLFLSHIRTEAYGSPKL